MIAARTCVLMLVGVVAMSSTPEVEAQKPKVNYSEADVKPYTLPDALVTEKGRSVTSAELWTNVRRPELLKLFASQVYGKTPTPPQPIKPAYVVVSEDREALGGKAVRREVTIRFNDEADGPRMELLIYLPKSARKDRPAPAFLGLNFEGNQAVTNEPGVRLSTAWMRDNHNKGIVDHRAT
jgi:hypothetical protein